MLMNRIGELPADIMMTRKTTTENDRERNHLQRIKESRKMNIRIREGLRIQEAAGSVTISGAEEERKIG